MPGTFVWGRRGSVFAALGALTGILTITAACSQQSNKPTLAAAPLGSGSDAPIKSAPAKRQTIQPADLPPPFATKSAENHARTIPRPEDAALTLPPGFSIATWADGLENPRILTVAPNGDIFVAESGPNRVRVLRDADGDGKPETRSVFSDQLSQPFGIAFYPPGPHPTHVYVANTASVTRFPYKKGDLKASGPPETIVPDLTPGGYRQHWTRNIVFRPDGKKMYVSVGSQHNAAEEPEKRAAILEYNPDGSGYRVYASGLRNPVGLAFNPVGGALWTAVNERDGLGDDLVPDYATSVKENGFYGYPWYYIGQNKDPRLPDRPDKKAKVTVPDVLFVSHTAALGIDFYTGTQFPAEYRKDAFVAQHGSWNRSRRSGYAVVRVPMGPDGKAEGGFEDFITGWTTPDGKVWGRPVDVAVARDGSLLVSDDDGGKIWRVTYKSAPR